MTEPSAFISVRSSHAGISNSSRNSSGPLRNELSCGGRHIQRFSAALGERVAEATAPIGVEDHAPAFSPRGAASCSQGREPLVKHVLTFLSPGRGDIVRRAVSPLTGLWQWKLSKPGACAPGYITRPLRGQFDHVQANRWSRLPSHHSPSLRASRPPFRAPPATPLHPVKPHRLQRSCRHWGPPLRCPIDSRNWLPRKGQRREAEPTRRLQSPPGRPPLPTFPEPRAGDCRSTSLLIA
jgi:hypothetical protein